MTNLATIVYYVDKEYAEELAGQPLTDDQLDTFTEAVGNSSVPDALREILASIIETEV